MSWTAATLGEISDIQTGPFGSQLHSKDYTSGEGTPIVTVEHLGERKFTRRNLPLVSDDDRNRLQRYTMRAGDIIFSRVGSVDRCSLAMDENDGWLFSGRCLRIRPHRQVDSNYLYSYLTLPNVKQFIRNIAVGATMPSINTAIMGEVPVSLPPLKTQAAIGDFSRRLNDKIELNNLLNDYLATACVALVEIMNVEGTATLADISSQVNVKTACGAATIDSYVSTESLLPDKGGRQTASALPTTGKVTVYQPEDTLVSNIRPYFKKVWYADRVGTCSSDVIVFRAKEPELAPYLYSVLRSDSYFDHVMAGAKGTKMPRGDKRQMMQYPVASDFNEEELKILTSMVNQISVNNRENDRLSELRDALLPKLMSGEIDVSKIELPTQPNNHLDDC